MACREGSASGLRLDGLTRPDEIPRPDAKNEKNGRIQVNSPSLSLAAKSAQKPIKGIFDVPEFPGDSFLNSRYFPDLGFGLRSGSGCDRR